MILPHLAVTIPGWLQVFLLFFLPLPWNPGPAAGIVLARSYGLSTGFTIGLYVASDVALALIFEPLARLVRHRLQFSVFGALLLETYGRFGRWAEAAAGRLGLPFAMLILSFITDLFTAALISIGLPINRLVAWAAIITGDLLSFLILFLASVGIATYLTDNHWVLFGATFVLSGVIAIIFQRLALRRREPVGGPR